LGLWPKPVPFETLEGAGSPVVGAIVEGPAAALTAVALVAGAGARASGWAADAAVAVARGWPRARTAVLVDAAGEAEPGRSLRDAAGVAGDEGLADVAEYGLSLGAVRRRVEHGGYDVVTAGVYVPDPATLRDEALWTRLLADAAAELTTLLVYLPAGEPGTAELVRLLGAAVVLAEPAEAEDVVAALPSAYSVLAVLVPPGAAAEAAEADAAEADANAAAAEADDEPLVIAAAADEALHGTPPATGPGDVAAGAAPGGAGEPDDAVLPGAKGSAGAEAGRLSDEEFERIRLPTDRVARDALIAELRERQRAARMAPPGAAAGGGHAAGADAGGGDAADPAGAPGAPGAAGDRAAAGPAGAASEAGAAGGAGAAGEADFGGDAGAGATPRVLVPAGESEHAREMRLEAGADDMTLDTLDPGPAESRGWGPAGRRSGLRRGLGWTLTVVFALSVLAGAWRFLSGRLGVVMPADRAVPVDAAPAAGDDVAFVTREVALPYAVALEAHTDLEAAFSRFDALGNEPGLSFHIAPLERDGALYYHVMAGPVPDSATALALRDTLVTRRLKTAATPTDVRYAPLSFLVGDFGDRHNAEQSMRELRRLDVPSYYLMADAADGYPMYRVYVGGFASAAEADVTRQLLRAAGVPDSLVTRTGNFQP
jgi:hypothetical protein